MEIKEITIEINGKKYHGFLYEIAKPSSQHYYMNHSIEELDLSVRTYNCLKRVGINNFYDIRQKVVINEWQMNKYGSNRMKAGKKIKHFYEVELSLPKLTEYWGESEIKDE